jgi:hypothetical protein
MAPEAVRRGRLAIALAIAACAVMGFIALVLRDRVPLLGLVNLGFHELGHLVTYPFPDLFTAMMGSITQVAVPAGLAAYFGWARRDPVAAGLCLAWAGSSAQEASVYIADAPYQDLPLIGGHHDWAFVLGRLGALDAADELATVVLFLAWGLVLGGIALCARPLFERAHAPPPAPGEVRVRSISFE